MMEFALEPINASMPFLAAAPKLTLENVLLLASGIFCVGVYGILSRQNVLVLLMCVELILNAANLALVGFGRALVTSTLGNVAGAQAASTSHAFVVMVLAVAAAEAAVGLAILLVAYRKWRTVRVGDISSLSG